MENKEDYVGYEDQELCNRYYKEAEAMRQKQDWPRLRAVPAPAKGTPSPGWALTRPCKNRIYDKSLKGYEGKPLCSECAAIEYDKED